MKYYPFYLICVLVFFGCSSSGNRNTAGMPVEDIPYKAPVSVKYTINPKWAGAHLQKVAVDGDNNVYVLTDKGLYRDFPDNVLSKDLLYSSLADKMPVDICIQEETGYLYYLYPDRFLTNEHAGSICGHLPVGEYTQMAVNANDDVLLISSKNAVLYHRSDKKEELGLPAGKYVRLYVYDRSFWYLADNAVYRLEGSSWKEIHKGENLTSLAFSEKTIAVGTSDGYYVMDGSGKIVQEKNNRLPVPAIHNLLFAQWEGKETRLWFSTSDGAFVKEPDRFRYFASGRWLNQDSIIDMTADRSGNIYLLTPAGLNKVEYENQTLLGKAEIIENNLKKYHIRYGFSNESVLLDPADPTSIRLNDTDNDGLWTSFWLGSQAFRYAVTKEPQAKNAVWESFEAFERLISIHSVKGFSGRTFERKGYNVSDLERWNPAIDSVDWVWKGTTSTDEYVAYIFNTAVMDQFVTETPEEKKRLTDYIDAIMTHIITNDYYFVDYNGKPTLWGRWNPDYVNSFAKTQFDRRLNSALIIAGLQLAYKLTDKEIYKSEAFRIMDEWGYRENMKIPMKDVVYTTGFVHEGFTLGEDWNHSDDEMAFLTYWALYHYAFNDTLKQEYKTQIKDHWEIEKPERNGLWNLLSYGTSGDIDLESTIWYLREFPVDCRRYDVHNKHRKDLEFLPKDPKTNFREQTTTQLPTKGERPMNKHNANEFELESRGGSHMSLAGDEYLLPYWIARYLKVVE